MRAESEVELVGPPAFDVGQRVRCVRPIRNDGTFAGRAVGERLVAAGDVGWVASIGTFLQQFYIYAVFFKDQGQVVGCRARELELAEEDRSCMTRNEERFLAAAGIDRVDAPVEAFTAALAARQGPLAAAPAGGRTLEDLRRLGDAEAFFAFFDLPFVPEVVRVYRLHILKRFALEMEVVDRARPDAPEAERLALYREALARAHDLFTRSTAQRERLFRVFHGEGVVTIGRAP